MAAPTSSPTSDLPDRVTAAAQDARDACQAWHLAIAQRDALIVAAIDEGYSERSVAGFAGIDPATLRTAIARAEAAAA